jgi:hypothetical protein
VAVMKPTAQASISAFVCIVLLISVFGLLSRSLERNKDRNMLRNGQLEVSNISPPDQTGNIFVSYSYFEKDDVQVRSATALFCRVHHGHCSAVTQKFSAERRA